MKWYPAVCVNGHSKKLGCVVEYVLNNGVYDSVHFHQKCENHKDVKDSELLQVLFNETAATEAARDVIRQAFKAEVYQQPLTLELLHKYHPNLKNDFFMAADEQAPYELDINRNLQITIPEELKSSQVELAAQIHEKNSKASLR